MVCARPLRSQRSDSLYRRCRNGLIANSSSDACYECWTELNNIPKASGVVLEIYSTAAPNQYSHRFIYQCVIPHSLFHLWADLPAGQHSQTIYTIHIHSNPIQCMRCDTNTKSITMCTCTRRECVCGAVRCDSPSCLIITSTTAGYQFVWQLMCVHVRVEVQSQSVYSCVCLVFDKLGECEHKLGVVRAVASHAMF